MYVILYSIGLPGEPAETRIIAAVVGLQCHNVTLSWTPKPNYNLSEIVSFKVEHKNGSTFNVVPATEWNSNLSLCSCEPQTCYKIVAVDKCGRESNPVLVELKRDMNKGKELKLIPEYCRTPDF